MADDKPKTINEEAGLPDNWIPIDAPPIIPSSNVPTADGSSKYLQGSLSPASQHDVSFTGTAYKQDRTPQLSLMPLAPSGDASTNSGVQSVIQKVIEQSGSSGLVLETNGNQNSNQLLLDLEQGSGITLSNADGRTTISASVTSVPQWPLPNTAVAYMARAIVGQTALQCIGDNAPNTSSAGSGAVGNGALPTSADGVAVPVTTGASTNSAFGWNASGGGIFRFGRSLIYQCRVRFSSGTASGNAYLGFTDQTAANLRPPIGGNTVAFSTNFGTLQGVIVTEIINLSFVIDGNTHTYEIVMDDVNNVTTFFIDGANVGSFAGGNPSGTNCWPTVSIVNKTIGGTTAVLNMQYFYGQQAF